MKIQACKVCRALIGWRFLAGKWEPVDAFTWTLHACPQKLWRNYWRRQRCRRSMGLGVRKSLIGAMLRGGAQLRVNAASEDLFVTRG